MEAIGYGILIALLMGVSSFTGAWFVMKTRNANTIRDIIRAQIGGGDAEKEAIMKAYRPLQYDSEPKTAEEFDALYKRETFSEAVRDGTPRH